MTDAVDQPWEREGELEFNFNELGFSRPEKGRWPNRMRVVDFVVQQPTGRKLYIEVKEPGSGTASSQDKARSIREMREHILVDNILVPKCRDTFLCEWLMGEQELPVDYVVLLDLSNLEGAEPFRPTMRDRLAQRLRQEMSEPWVRQYARTSIVISPGDWHDRFGIQCRQAENAAETAGG